MIAKIPSLYHFDSSKGSRVKCDASHNGLGACLEQEVEPGVLAPTAFASRFLNNAEVKYSTNELELLAIVWACEHFRTYLLGTRFQVLTDHKAIISALSENYNNKSYQSRLARWVDHLLPFDFEVFHVRGITLGIVDYLSRYPTFPAPAPSKYDELFVVKSIGAFHLALSFINCYNSSPGHQFVSHKRAFNLCLNLRTLVIYVIRRLRVFLMSLNVSTNHLAVCKWIARVVCNKRASIYALKKLINQGPVC